VKEDDNRNNCPSRQGNANMPESGKAGASAGTRYAQQRIRVVAAAMRAADQGEIEQAERAHDVARHRAG